MKQVCFSFFPDFCGFFDEKIRFFFQKVVFLEIQKSPKNHRKPQKKENPDQKFTIFFLRKKNRKSFFSKNAQKSGKKEICHQIRGSTYIPVVKFKKLVFQKILSLLFALPAAQMVHFKY